MAFLEKLGRSVKSASDRLHEASTELDRAGRNEAYTRARLTELTPLLNRIVALEIAEQAASEGLTSALTRLDLARKIRERVVARAESGRETEQALRQEKEALANFEAAKQKHGRLAGDLRLASAETAQKDGELRRRFDME